MTAQVGGQIDKQKMELEQQEGNAIIEKGVQESPQYQKNEDKKVILTIDLNKKQLEDCLDAIDEAMKQFCKEYDIPDELFTTLKEDGLIAFGQQLASLDMDTFFSWLAVIMNVTIPFIGMGISKIGTKIEQKISKTAGKWTEYIGNAISFVPMVLYFGRTIYDDFLEDVRYMGSLKDNAEITSFDLAGLLIDLFIMPGTMSEKAVSIVISGIFLLIDGITMLYNYIEGQDQVKQLQEWYDQQVQELQKWSETFTSGKNKDNQIYIDFI